MSRIGRNDQNGISYFGQLYSKTATITDRTKYLLHVIKIRQQNADFDPEVGV